MRWVVLCGAVLLMLSGVNWDPEPERGGPVNILLAGTPPHPRDEVPRAESVMVMHLPQGADRGYLFALPRDLVVAIPAFAKSGYGGAGIEKLANAMVHGARDPEGGPPDPAQGLELLAQTVSAYTGLERFDASVIIDSAQPDSVRRAVRELRPQSVTLIHLTARPCLDDGQHLGEELDMEAFSFFDSLLDGTVDSYVVQHPEMISGAV